MGTMSPPIESIVSVLLAEKTFVSDIVGDRPLVICSMKTSKKHFFLGVVCFFGTLLFSLHPFLIDLYKRMIIKTMQLVGARNVLLGGLLFEPIWCWG